MNLGQCVLSIGFIFSLCTFGIPVQAKMVVPIDDYLRSLQIEPSEALGIQPLALLDEEPSSEFVELPGLDGVRQSQVCGFQGRAFAAAVCREATALCRAHTGDPACWLPSELRFRSHRTRKQVFQIARSIFESIRNNHRLASKCCDSAAQPAHCQETFENSRLSIIIGGRPADDTCEFKYRTGTLQVSEGMLLACRDVSCISASFLHEFGHACAYARLNSPQDRRIYISGVRDESFCEETSESVGQMTKMFEQTFGAETTRCVVLGLKSRPGGCFAARLQEAFADGAFMNERTNLSQFAWDCEYREDASHAKPSSYEHCFMRRSEVRRNFCP